MAVPHQRLPTLSLWVMHAAIWVRRSRLAFNRPRLCRVLMGVVNVLFWPDDMTDGEALLRRHARAYEWFERRMVDRLTKLSVDELRVLMGHIDSLTETNCASVDYQTGRLLREHVEDELRIRRGTSVERI